MRNSLLPLLLPKYALSCPEILLWYLDLGVPLNNSWTNFEGRQSSCPLGVSIKGIGRAFNWLKCLGGFLHLKPTVGCQISTLIFENKIMEGDLYKYPMQNILRTHSSWPLGVSIKGISRALNWHMCLGGFLHLKPTAGFQISTLIFDFFLWRGVSINIIWKIY